jgi:hypothetical protein
MPIQPLPAGPFSEAHRLAMNANFDYLETVLNTLLATGTGPSGIQGPQGPQGMGSGEVGDPGEQGVMGPQGIKGSDAVC